MTYKDKVLAVVAVIAVVAGVGVYIFVPKNTNDIKIEKPLGFNVQEYKNLDVSTMEEGQKKQYETSLDLLSKNEDDKEGLIGLANVFYSFDKHNEAEKILNYTWNKYPDDIIILQNLGSIYNGQKRFADEEAIYYKLLDLNIVWMPAFDNLLSLYRFNLVPFNDKYYEYASKARDYDYGDQYESDLLRSLGFYYKYAGDNMKAQEYLGLYLKRKPDDVAIQDAYKEVGGIKNTIEFR